MHIHKYIGPIDITRIVLISTLIGMFCVIIANNIHVQTHQQLLIQTQSWLQGRLDLIGIEPGVNDLDTIKIGDKYYWPPGPFPSLVLVPFAALGNLLNIPIVQGFSNLVVVIVIFFLCYKLAIKHGFNGNAALLLALGFCFSTNFIEMAINPSSWYFSQSVTTLALFLAFYEYYHQKRFLLIGIALAAAVGSRITAGIATLFFVLSILDHHKFNINRSLAPLTKLVAPLCLVILLLSGFNYARYGTITETGYATNILYNDHNPEADPRRNLGLFRIEHIPGNLYWYFFHFPSVTFSNNNLLPTVTRNIEGTSLFLVCPIFFFLLKRRSLTNEEKYLLITVGATFFVLLTYYHWGGAQLSARYTLDFTPLLFLLLLKTLPNPLKKIHYIVILGSAFLNFYLLSL